MQDANPTAMIITPMTERVFTIAECPECESFTGARRAWCLNEAKDIQRANKWRKGMKLRLLPSLATSQVEATQPKPERIKEWTPDQPARGLGDVIAKVTHATGIDAVVKKVTKGGCGCKKRQEALNAAVPFKRSE